MDVVERQNPITPGSSGGSGGGGIEMDKLVVLVAGTANQGFAGGTCLCRWVGGAGGGGAAAAGSQGKEINTFW